MSIWCPGSSEQVYTSASDVRCPSCGAIVAVTKQGHIKPHVEAKVATKAAPAKK